MEEILKKISKYNNFKDITTYAEQIIEDYRKNNKKPKLSQAFEAMNLYNMYIDAMDGKNCEEYLYPFKLRKVIDETGYKVMSIETVEEEKRGGLFGLFKK